MTTTTWTETHRQLLAQNAAAAELRARSMRTAADRAHTTAVIQRSLSNAS